MKHTKCQKFLALSLTLGLLAGALSACGKPVESGQTTPSGNGGAPVPETGRYVEREVILPRELTAEQILQMFKADGRLHLLTMRQEEEKTFLREWELQETGFSDVTADWLDALELPSTDWLDAQLIPGSNGRQYLYAGYLTEENSFLGHLWKSDGASAEEITPEKWFVPNEDWGGYEMIQGLAALDNGDLIALSYTSVDLLSGEDGRVLESEAFSTFYEGGVITDGRNVYLRFSDSAGGQIEKRKGGRSGDLTVIPFPAGSAADGSFSFGGGGSFSLDVLSDGSLIAACKKGIFRLTAEDTEGQWTLLADGMETDFSSPDLWCIAFNALEDGTIYALFQSEETQRLNRYEYDPDAASEVKETLTIYSIYENSMLRQAAALYHKEHPEVVIDIQSEYPLHYEDTPDYDSIYKKLNTMLLGDHAPDMLVMDHLDADSYVSRGLLADLTEVLKPLEDSKELLSNITNAYIREDGSLYVVPLQFSFTLAMGREILPENMDSLEALADFLGRTDISYMGPQTAAELTDLFYPFFCDEIVSEKQLDQDVLARYLGYLKTIADNCGFLNSRPADELSYGMWDLASKSRLAFYQAQGFMDCLFPMSLVDYIKGDFTAFENRFIPSSQLAICRKCRYPDTAEDFLRFALSRQVQDFDSYDGFPVNRLSLEALAQKDRSGYVSSALIMADDGEFLEFESKAYSASTAERLAEICRNLNKPVKEDEKIRETLLECLDGYLGGTQSLEQTIRKIEDALKMYLAE